MVRRAIRLGAARLRGVLRQVCRHPDVQVGVGASARMLRVHVSRPILPRAVRHHAVRRVDEDLCRRTRRRVGADDAVPLD